MSEPTTHSVAEARDQLTRLIREVEFGNAVRLTRRGRRVAVLISEAEYARLTGETSKSFKQVFRDFMKARPRGVGVTDAEVARWRDRSPGRDVKY